MKRILSLLLFLLSMLTLSAQSTLPKKYGPGAVPVVNGYVQFEKTYNAPGKSKAELIDSIKAYIQRELVDGPEQLPQARLTEVTPDSGIVAASIEEYIYFKRTNWQIHRVRFYYQLVAHVTDGSYTLTMRRLHYRYDPEVTAGEFDEDRAAEHWITDDAALKKNGTKLQRISGKFRTHTIDRKNAIFRAIAQSCGVKIAKRTQILEVEEDE